MKLNPIETADLGSLRQESTGPLRRRQPAVGTVRAAWLVLLAALAMTVLEGALRKWVFPGGGAVKYGIYFSKDFIFAGLVFLRTRQSRSEARSVFEVWLLPGSVFFAVGAALSSLTDFSLVGAALTARAAVLLPLLA